MDINNIVRKSLDFTLNRVTELFGLAMIVVALMLSICLASYSPEDPNFIFSENTEIKNILGFYGSLVSDLLFQSIGLISLLFCATIFFTGINLIRFKKIMLLIDNLFFSVIYIIFGSLFFSVFYPNSFWLSFNGNGGFVGKFFQNTFLSSVLNINLNISYYF